MPHAGHFIGSRSCLFRLCTYVNGYIISSVGDYIVNGEVEEIGVHRTHETMVFKATKNNDTEQKCCPYKMKTPSEIEMVGYSNSTDAVKGHMKLVKKYKASRPPVIKKK